MNIWYTHALQGNLLTKIQSDEYMVFPCFARQLIDPKVFYNSKNKLNSGYLDELIFLQELFWKKT